MGERARMSDQGSVQKKGHYYFFENGIVLVPEKHIGHRGSTHKPEQLGLPSFFQLLCGTAGQQGWEPRNKCQYGGAGTIG